TQRNIIETIEETLIIQQHGREERQLAVAAQRAVTDTTNDLLTANAEMLKQNAIETATENERGIVDLDTLKRTQRNIIETIEETLIIQQHGREERQLAEKELQQLEQDLKSHLVNIKGPNKQS
uniref:toxic anion resistance protein n=1 Tax=Staphylococcus aureus TaxID=1280 RepID=UPI0037DD82E8